MKVKFNNNNLFICTKNLYILFINYINKNKSYFDKNNNGISWYINLIYWVFVY